MGQRGREGGLAETIAAQRLSGTSSPLGGGADAVMDRPTEEDEQRLRKALCERRSVGVRCHDSPHDEAARPCLRTFHTASPRTPVKRAFSDAAAFGRCHHANHECSLINQKRRRKESSSYVLRRKQGDRA